MDIKHQVFVSSTYKDLVEQRKAVIHALLELDCIPAGMELFPATDEDAWSLIKEVIDGCDYYMLLVAGKYGSVSSSGISYTEMEFDYAVDTGKPILVFLHENSDSLPSTVTEKNPEIQAKLDVFKEKAKAKHCKFWTSAEDLGGKVSRSLVQLKKRHPSPGWIPGRYAASSDMLRELDELRTKVAQLELAAVMVSDGEDISHLSQGADLVYLSCDLKKDAAGKKENLILKCSWDELLSYFGANMSAECTDREMIQRCALCFFHSMSIDLQKLNSFKEIVIPYVVEDKILVQFQALGYIAPGIKKRAVADRERYWRLTPKGEKHMLSVRAQQR
ncbi:DUF4062 domain-containing protein [Janthinobacterium sp. BJB401]|uniref:DUF4062 domain-containing protein n=1 Tax=Janthinobacterium sp. BJB401 TaxID=2745934 RepID=UPI001594FC62|nr:DUF4062 domain-containing protein [Janthinobacterium sp. BJB401]NVI81919.1 DUF4062 domain-containing protein [Janthinobacterium sp. BJB401]